MTIFTVTNDQIINGRLPVIPEGVDNIKIDKCHNLEWIDDEIPADVESIVIVGCPNLKAVTAFPEKLKELQFDCCDVLQQIGELPNGLERVDFVECKSLILTEEQIEDLLQIKEFGNVKHPRSLNFVNQLSHHKLAKMISECKEINPNFEGAAVKRLMEDILEVATKKFTGFEYAKSSKINNLIISPVLGLLDKNPHHLSFVDESIKYNRISSEQTVLAWLKIPALINIADKETMKDKLEAAKQLLALQVIYQFVNKDNNQNRAVLSNEELISIMCREVQAKEHSYEYLNNNDEYNHGVNYKNIRKSINRLNEEVKSKMNNLSLDEVASAIVKLDYKSWYKSCFQDDVMQSTLDILKQERDFTVTPETSIGKRARFEQLAVVDNAKKKGR